MAPSVYPQATAPAGDAPVDPATLARYDTNRNGTLEPAERAAMEAEQRRVAAAAPTSTSTTDETIVLSPFQVDASADEGYYAANTLSGTRLNTRIEDLAASMTVVTKQQMADFAMLDVNDIFNYEASTEGTGNYTDFSVDRNGMVIDQVQNNPQGANRIRGVSAANVALGNFATSGRVPVDPIAIDAVEISRGPNSNIFGLGEGSGTVNLIPSTANLNRVSTRTEFRIDDRGGYRTSIDVNRPIVSDVLALRGTAVYQRDEYPQEPSGGTTRRVNLMLRAQPYRSTSIRASFESYRYNGTRPNTITPRDGVSYWRSLGAGTWDPVTSTLTVNGVSTVMVNPTGAALNAVGLQESPSSARPSLFIDRNGIELWMINRMPAATATEVNAPNNAGGSQRLLETTAEPRTGRPLFSTWPGISDRAVYDWKKINLGGINSIDDDVDTYAIDLEQWFINTERHKLAAQLSWQREDADRINRNVVGQASATGQSGFLYVDINERLLDGRPNPYFLRPYIGVNEPTTSNDPLQRDSYRGQVAYELDFSRADNWTKWLGRHRIVGYSEMRNTRTQRFRFRDVVISDHPFNPAGQPKANQSGATGAVSGRGYFHYYVGDSQGQNIEYAPEGFEYGDYPFQWFLPTPAPGEWQTTTVTLGQSAVQEGSQGNFANRTVIKTRGVVMQNYLLNIGGFERIVTTLGRRRDQNNTKFAPPAVLLPNGYEFDYAATNGYIGDWATRKGFTTTKGVVVKPLRWLNLYYNEADSFRPDSPAINVLRQTLPNPTSEGYDFGFALNFWDGRFVVRANRYMTEQVNIRNGQAGTFGQRVLRLDFENYAGNNDAQSLQRQARAWVREQNPGFSDDQVNAAVYSIMQLTPEEEDAYRNNTISETQDLVSRGDEIELNLNPDPFWTLKVNITRTRSIDDNITPAIPAWIERRMPVWTTIMDPRGSDGILGTEDDGPVPWFTETYPGTASAFLQGNVVAPIRLLQASQGKSRSQIREWRVNASGRLRLAKFTNHRTLRNMDVGASVRWEDKGSIGYFGIPIDGNIFAATEYDPSRPIYDKSHLYVDMFVTYNTRLWDDRVRARFQLNVRNLGENGRLQPTGAYPDGRPHTFRIIEPQQFIFTASFDL